MKVDEALAALLDTAPRAPSVPTGLVPNILRLFTVLSESMRMSRQTGRVLTLALLVLYSCACSPELRGRNCDDQSDCLPTEICESPRGVCVPRSAADTGELDAEQDGVDNDTNLEPRDAEQDGVDSNADLEPRDALDIRDRDALADSADTSSDTSELDLEDAVGDDVLTPTDCVVFVDGDIGILGARDGLSWNTAADDLNSAVAAAYGLSQAREEACEVWVADGTYSVWITAATDSLELRDGVAIYGGFDGFSNPEDRRSQRDPITHASIISGSDGGGNQVYHVVTADNVTGARLDGVVIRDGYARTSDLSQRPGGGLRIVSSTVTLANTVVENNLATWGGGFAINDSAITVESSIIRNNAASSRGGGIHWYGSGTGTFTDVEITGNSTTEVSGSDGGGLYLTAGPQLTFTRAHFEANEIASGSGGAIHIDGFSPPAHVTCTECSFHRNRAGHGGAIYLEGGTGAVLDRSEFIANRGQGEGGAINVRGDGTTVTVTNSLFMYNFTSLNNGDGGAVYMLQSATGSFTNDTFFGNVASNSGVIGHSVNATATFTNCLWSQNRADVNPEAYDDGMQTLTFTASEGTFSGTGNKTVADPELDHVPQAVTATTSTLGGTQIVVEHSGFAEIGDTIEIDDDGVARLVGNVTEDTTLNFTPVSSGTWPDNVIVANWGASTDTTENLRLTSGSVCVDAADGDVATDYDKDNLSPRFDAPSDNGGVGTPNYVDMGCYEYR